jgi:hypothetical protein
VPPRAGGVASASGLAGSPERFLRYRNPPLGARRSALLTIAVRIGIALMVVGACTVPHPRSQRRHGAGWDSRMTPSSGIEKDAAVQAEAVSTFSATERAVE